MDPDPGGPKTYGSDRCGFGSATLLETVELKIFIWAPDPGVKKHQIQAFCSSSTTTIYDLPVEYVLGIRDAFLTPVRI